MPGGSSPTSRAPCPLYRSILYKLAPSNSVSTISWCSGCICFRVSCDVPTPRYGGIGNLGRFAVNGALWEVDGKVHVLRGHGHGGRPGRHVLQMVRFLLVGAVGFVVDATILLLLTQRTRRITGLGT